MSVSQGTNQGAETIIVDQEEHIIVREENVGWGTGVKACVLVVAAAMVVNAYWEMLGESGWAGLWQCVVAASVIMSGLIAYKCLMGIRMLALAMASKVSRDVQWVSVISDIVISWAITQYIGVVSDSLTHRHSSGVTRGREAGFSGDISSSEVSAVLTIASRFSDEAIAARTLSQVNGGCSTVPQSLSHMVRAKDRPGREMDCLGKEHARRKLCSTQSAGIIAVEEPSKDLELISRATLDYVEDITISQNLGGGSRESRERARHSVHSLGIKASRGALPEGLKKERQGMSSANSDAETSGWDRLYATWEPATTLSKVTVATQYAASHKLKISKVTKKQSRGLQSQSRV